MSTSRRGPSGGSSDASRHRALSAVSRVRMLRLIREAADGMTAAQVATATALHPSTVRAHLEQLAESGLLVRHRRPDGSPGRPAWLYQAVERPEPAADLPYRDLAAALIGHLARSEDDPHAAGIRAGRDWGRSLAGAVGPCDPVDGLVRVLGQLSFSPDVMDRPDATTTVLRLRTCPFLDLAEASPDVVCGVHLGVISGALGALGASAADTVLEPFALPGACVVRVRDATRPRRASAASLVAPNAPGGGR